MASIILYINYFTSFQKPKNTILYFKFFNVLHFLYKNELFLFMLLILPVMRKQAPNMNSNFCCFIPFVVSFCFSLKLTYLYATCGILNY